MVKRGNIADHFARAMEIAGLNGSLQKRILLTFIPKPTKERFAMWTP